MKRMQDERNEKENKNYYSYAITNLYRIYHKIYIYIYIYIYIWLPYTIMYI